MDRRIVGVWLLRRVGLFALTLFAASLVIFAILELLPGNPAAVILGPSAPPEAVAALARELGLDRPAPERYAAWIGGMLRGDFGQSYAYNTPVSSLLGERLQLSLPLACLSLAITTALSLAFGLFAAARHGTAADLGVMGVAQIGLAIPNFWFGILLILLFAVKLHWVAAGGFPGWSAGPVAALGALILPACALALAQTAVLARVTRGAVLEVLREDFVRTAYAKGLTRRAVLWRHVLRNALIPIVTIMGLQFGNTVAGTVVIENVFTLPGIGRLAFQAIANRDLIVLRSVMIVFAGFVIALALLTDVVHGLIDPRLEASRV